MIFGSPEYLKQIRETIGKSVFKDDPYYLVTTKHEAEMSPHMYGTPPIDILNRVRPREDDEIKKYRIASYEPITLATGEKALSTVVKIWTEGLYSIKPKENDRGKELYKYLMEDFPKFKSVFRYSQVVVTKKMMADSNAWMVLMPSNPNAPSTERIQATPRIFSSKKLHYQDADTMLFLNRVVKKDLINEYIWVDKNFIMLVKIEITPREVISTIIWQYKTNFGSMPCRQLQGTPYVEDYGEDEVEVVYYKSFFYPAIPFWNKAINHESDLDGAFINHLHPIRVEIAEDCDYHYEGKIRCTGGKIQLREEGKSITCPQCNGTGKKQVKGPFGVVYVAREKLDPDAPQVNQAVSYVTVPTDATKMLDERVDKLLERGLHALNMDVVNKIGENQSGVAKEQDRTELTTFLQKVSDVGYDIVDFIILYTAMYAYGRDTQNLKETVLPEVNRPSDFDINSLDEMISQLKEANETGMNASYRKAKQIAIQNKEFSSYPDLKKRLNSILNLDPLPQVSQEELSMMLLSRTTSTKKAVIHSNLDDFVSRALDEHKEKFFEMDRPAQVKILEKYADEIIEENKVEIDLNAIDDGTGSTGQQSGKPNNPGGGNVQQKGGGKSKGDVGGGKPNSGEA